MEMKHFVNNSRIQRTSYDIALEVFFGSPGREYDVVKRMKARCSNLCEGFLAKNKENVCLPASALKGRQKTPSSNNCFLYIKSFPPYMYERYDIFLC